LKKIEPKIAELREKMKRSVNKLKFVFFFLEALMSHHPTRNINAQA